MNARVRGRGGGAIPSVEKIDRKLRRLRQIEASYHREIKRALETSRDTTLDPTKAKIRYERRKAKSERKIEKLQPKIRTLTNLRAELKAGRTAKG